MSNAPARLGSEWACLAVLAGAVSIGGGGCFPPALPQADIDGDGDVPTEVATDTDGLAETADGVDTDAVDTTDMIELIDMVDTIDTIDGDGSDVDAGPTRPGDVSVSTSRVDSVEVSWNGVPGANAYRVERCTMPCGGTWSEIAPSVSGLSFIDEDVAVPAIPGPPDNVAATMALTDRVDVSWSTVTAEPARRYWYRVTAIGSGGEGGASEPAEGGVAERPVTGYEVLIGSNWVSVGTTTWRDDAAPAPSLSAGTATASQASSATHVALSVAGSTASPGAPREYAVRVVTSYGWSAPSETVSGQRQAGALRFQWERSAGASADEFGPISGATTTTFNDTNAPADGSTRWYRVVISADGAEPLTSEPVAGARQGAPSVPGAVQASSDLVDRVEVGWQAVSGAIGYHVYRDGVKLTAGNGIAVTSYTDLAAPAATQAWGAPSAVAATTSDFDKVIVSWVAPARPQGATVVYLVTAVSAAGEGAQSGEAIGRRVGVALVGYDVEVTPSGGNAMWVSTGTTETTWNHMTAPAGVITPGTITATPGTARAHVSLNSSGASVAQPGSVTYRVRGALANATTTAASGLATGRRVMGSLQRRWQRMNATGSFDDLPGTGISYQDATAPSDGSSRTYRLALSATGAVTVNTPTAPGARLAFYEIAVGARHTCGFSEWNGLWCWGANDYGQLGRGNTSAHEPAGKVAMPNSNEPIAMALGQDHTCVFDEEGAVYCWGRNTMGQLGDGTITSRLVPTLISSLSVYGGGSIETTRLRITAGVRHTCVIDSVGVGQARCWGDNGWGQVGQDGGGFYTTPIQPELPSHVLQEGSDVIVASGTGACTFAGREGWFCWGRGGHGLDFMGVADVVYASPLLAGTKVSLGDDHGCLIPTAGAPRCWSNDNAFGQVGNGALDSWSAEPTPIVGLTSASTIETIANTTFAVQSGVIYVWGDGGSGQIGDGASIAGRRVPTPINGPVFATPWKLAKGSPVANHMCALVDHAPRCWGANGSRQLGDGTNFNRSGPVPVNLP